MAERARAVVVIPKNFERDFLRGRQAEAQWLIDAVDANTANNMRGQAAALTNAFAAQSGAADVSSGKPAIKAETRMWYNPGASSRKLSARARSPSYWRSSAPLLRPGISREGERRRSCKSTCRASQRMSFAGQGRGLFHHRSGRVGARFLVAVPLFDLKIAGDPTPLLVGTVFTTAATSVSA